VTAVSVVFYIDYRIDRAVEAVTAPVTAASENVADTVDVATESLVTTLDDTRDDIVTEWENGRRIAGDISERATEVWGRIRG
jgi:hypothetical protein